MPVLERTVAVAGPLDLRRTLAPLRHGALDPTTRFGPDGVWRATRTAHGPATVHLAPAGGGVRGRAWGPGAGPALDAVADLVGAGDDRAGFQPGRHPVVAALARRLAGLRIPRTAAVLEALVPAVLEQKVPGVEARRAFVALVRAVGERAPGPAGDAGLLVPPEPDRLAALPSYAYHRWGVERRRAETVRRAAAVAPALERLAGLAPAEARRRLCARPGVGPWTAAEVALVALGDADAVPVGDYHLPHQVAWALAGEPRGDDARMPELLEPFGGHRGRVVRLVVAGGAGAPRFGPRAPLRSIAAL
ncbi:MAG: DNA-3-methyladenine glycosylase family protein [Acidimicrobiia bacterium]